MKKGIMSGHTGKNATKVMDVKKVMGVKSTKKPEPDDAPAKTPKEKNTGTSAAKRLAGKVIS